MISLSKIEEKLYRPADAYELSRVTRMEHVNTTIVEKPQEGIAAVAARIATLINRRDMTFNTSSNIIKAMGNSKNNAAGKMI